MAETSDSTVCLRSDWLCWNILRCDTSRSQASALISPPLSLSLSPHCSSLIPTTPSLPLSFDPLVLWRGSYTAWRSCVLSLLFLLTCPLLFLCSSSFPLSFTARDLLSKPQKFSFVQFYSSVISSMFVFKLTFQHAEDLSVWVSSLPIIIYIPLFK